MPYVLAELDQFSRIMRTLGETVKKKDAAFSLVPPPNLDRVGLVQIKKDETLRLSHVYANHEWVKFDQPAKHFRTIIEQERESPIPGLTTKPGKDNPLCGRCQLYQAEAKTPFLQFSGSEDPIITVIVEGVGQREDAEGVLGDVGPSGFVRRTLEEYAQQAGFDMSRIRYATVTRCHTEAKTTKTGWCANFLVSDLINHPPELIVPVGTTALGTLSHKGNAQDWAGRLLTYRGWPDDWLIKWGSFHPIFGHAPKTRLPLYPILKPSHAYATQNDDVIKRWRKSVFKILDLAKERPVPPTYDRPWFRITDDPDEVISAMKEIIAHRGAVTFDTETTGLYPQFGEAIVYMMFRWDGPSGPRAIGFPWRFPTSPLEAHRERLTPYILEALYSSKLIGHNLTFDMLFVFFDLKADLDRLARSMKSDTWHKLYTLRQRTGSLGLELAAYDWCPDMAGYEEEMTLLIMRHPKLLDPGEGEGGHYAMVLPEHKPAFKTYVMGDVEVAHVMDKGANEKLKKLADRPYKIPLASIKVRGRYRDFTPPTRDWVYDHVMLPASRVLMKMMARGMYVDQPELGTQEDLFPKLIKDKRDELRNSSPLIVDWCEQQEGVTPSWALDLENRGHLSHILFNILKLPVKRLTQAGQEIHGETPEAIEKLERHEQVQYASVDKFTLNVMAAEHPEVRPLQEYKKLFKQYSTYVRPMRNIFTAGIDKKQRGSPAHLSAMTGCVHAQFKICGTRSGRLSSSQPNLQNLPREGLVKRVYTSRFGKKGCIYQGDLSQIELRLIAAVCGDRAMVQAYLDNVDLHSLTTSKIFNVPYEHYEKAYMAELQRKGKEKEAKELDGQRKIGKTSNFLTGYGGGAYGLQSSLAEAGVYVTLEFCEEILEKFFDAYPGLRTHIGLYKDFISEYGVAVSLLGRVRIFEDAFSEDRKLQAKAFRSGYNHLIQSSASDIMLICLDVIEGLMREAKLKSILVSTVHDSLVADTLIDELPQVHEIVDAVINNIPEVLQTYLPGYDTSWIIVPLAGDSECGMNYLNSIKLDRNPNWAEVVPRLLKTATS